MSLEGLQGYVLQVLAWLVLSTGSTTSFIALNRGAGLHCTCDLAAQISRGAALIPMRPAPPPIAPPSAEGVARA